MQIVQIVQAWRMPSNTTRLDDLQTLAKLAAKLAERDTRTRIRFKELRDLATHLLTEMGSEMPELERQALALPSAAGELYGHALDEYAARCQRYGAALDAFRCYDVSEGGAK